MVRAGKKRRNALTAHNKGATTTLGPASEVKYLMVSAFLIISGLRNGLSIKKFSVLVSWAFDARFNNSIGFD